MISSTRSLLASNTSAWGLASSVIFASGKFALSALSTTVERTTSPIPHGSTTRKDRGDPGRGAWGRHAP